MRFTSKQEFSNTNQVLHGVNFHRFMEIEGSSNHMEIAQELGVSLRDVKKLKEKLNRS